MRQAILFLVGLASALPAQGTIAAGSRVRMIPSERYEPRRAGKVESVTSDSVVVRFEPVPELELRAERISVSPSRLEVLTGSKRYRNRGAAIGAVTLGVAGVIAAEQIDRTCWTSPAGSRSCDSDASAAPILGGVGLFVGAVTGALIGSLIKTETWEPVNRSTNVGFVPVASPRSVGLAFRLTVP